MNDKSKQIAKYNDQFRQNFGSPEDLDSLIQGKYFITSGVSDLTIPEQLAITIKTRNFEDFNKNNDPYEEHDFGKFSVNGHDIFGRLITTIRVMSMAQKIQMTFPKHAVF